MVDLTPEQRRGLRMAAQVACALSLLAAGAGTSMAKSAEPNEGDRDVSAVERTEDALRLRGQGGGCFQPVTWGPPAPTSIDPESLASITAMLAPTTVRA